MRKAKSMLVVTILLTVFVFGNQVFAGERHVPSEYPTIQAAIDAAVDGDTVLVSSGVYSENILWVGKTLTLKGVGDAPVLEASNPNAAAIFMYKVDSNSLIENFVIRNGYSAISPGESSLTLRNLTIVGNQLGISGHKANIRNCIFWDNNEDISLGGNAKFCRLERAWNGGERWIQEDSTFDYPTDYVGGGYFIYSYNYQERIRVAIEDEVTLEDMRNVINQDEGNPGVTASILWREGKYHLMLSSNQAGQDYRLSINPSSTEVWRADSAFTLASDDTLNASLTTKITELNQFSEHAGLLGSETVTISGVNHLGIDITPDLYLSILADTTVGDLIDAINEHFDSVAVARLVDGKIHLVSSLWRQ